MTGRTGRDAADAVTAPFEPPGDGIDRLLVVLGDQLDHRSALLDAGDPRRDVVVMMEVSGEATHVPSHRQRTVLFLSAMRHFAQELEECGWRVHYVPLNDPENTQSFTGEIARAVDTLRPRRIEIVRPGEHRVTAMAETWSERTGCPTTILDDHHFLTGQSEFAAWADGRKTFVMEHFYRATRRRLRVLMDRDTPVGGRWNFDDENRQRFTTAPSVPAPVRFSPDLVTTQVIELVNRQFPSAPGRVSTFGWPVTTSEARVALDDFIATRLGAFGNYQDAMWSEEPFLYHSLLSPALNLKLLDAHEVVFAAAEAYETGLTPINAAEGFVRQIIGWREFVRGVYEYEGPDYPMRNALNATGRLPAFFWTGDTDMACMRESIGQVLEHGYGHHIQRLMVTGNFALTAGVRPQDVADWYLGMYVDGVDWATAPNVIGMVMHADGGVVGTKPYAATGKYIQRMSNYCAGCRYDPAQRTGPTACPFTTLYWDFLIRHEDRFSENRRMTMMYRHVGRLSDGEVRGIRGRASALRHEFGVEG